MCESKLLQSFAMNMDREVISIRDVERGKACQCCCASCGELLIARQGDVNAWHFAHQSGAMCDGAAEGALHAAAKQIILNEKKMVVPALTCSVHHKLDDGREGEGIAIKAETVWNLENVLPEVTIKNIRPDIVAEVYGKPVFIEIAVTHFVDEAKKQIIEELGIPSIEIFLDPSDFEEWTWDMLKEAVIDNIFNKEWIFNCYKPHLENEAAKKAMMDALSKPKITSVDSIKHELSLFGVKMKVTEFDWGVTIWTPYDETVNALIKDIAKGYGGRWVPKYRNWSMPAGIIDSLLSKLKSSGAIEM